MTYIFGLDTDSPTLVAGTDKPALKGTHLNRASVKTGLASVDAGSAKGGYIPQNFARQNRVAQSCWTGRTGTSYLLASCQKDQLFAKDDQVILLAKQSGLDEMVLWVGHSRDLIDDPAMRLGFRTALAAMDHAYVTDAPADEDRLHILLWDLEKAILNLGVHAA